MSTAMGLQLGRASTNLREAAAAPFTRSDAFSMLPTTIIRGNQTNLESSYLGLVAGLRIPREFSNSL
jgi:hypothetical protein